MKSKEIIYELTLLSGCIEANRGSQGLRTQILKFEEDLKAFPKLEVLYELLKNFSSNTAEEIMLRIPFLTSYLTEGQVLDLMNRFKDNWEVLSNLISFMAAYREKNYLQLLSQTEIDSKVKGILINYFEQYPKKLTFGEPQEWQLKFWGIDWAFE